MGEVVRKMKSRLYVMRHAISKGNYNDIIQGGKDDHSLEETTIPDLYRLLSQHQELKEIKRIIHSPLKRAVMTARIAGEFFKRPICEDPFLIEVNAGVLSGMSKKEAALQRQKEYNIWTARGDLDQIQDAEKGDFLQARVIAFLERYIKEETNDLIISHAGFNRCLLNTLYGKPRTEKIDMSHNKIYTVEGVLDELQIQELDEATSSKVYCFNTSDKKYILKINSDDSWKSSLLESKITERLSNLGRYVPRTLNLYHKDGRTVKVLDYLEGNHFKDRISEDDRRILLAYIFEHHQDMISIGYEVTTEGIETLESKLRNTNVSNDILKMLFQKVLNKTLISRFIDNKRKSLVNYDLNRSNLFINRGRIGIIDLESFVYAPEEFQLPSFATCFFGVHSPDDFNIKWFIDNWPKRIGSSSFAYFSLCRSLIGANFFDRLLRKGEIYPTYQKLFDGYMKFAMNMTKLLDNL